MNEKSCLVIQEDDTALIAAAEAGHLECVTLLVEANCDVNAQNRVNCYRLSSPPLIKKEQKQAEGFYDRSFH